MENRSSHVFSTLSSAFLTCSGLHLYAKRMWRENPSEFKKRVLKCVRKSQDML